MTGKRTARRVHVWITSVIVSLRSHAVDLRMLLASLVIKFCARAVVIIVISSAIFYERGNAVRWLTVVLARGWKLPWILRGSVVLANLSTGYIFSLPVIIRVIFELRLTI